MQIHMKQFSEYSVIPPRRYCETMLSIYSPLVTTNPVTGWKGLFTGVTSLQAGHINDVTERENEILKDYCFSSLLHPEHGE